MQKKLENIGISNDTTIVIYDEYLDATPRLWFFLKYLGRNKICILNGCMEEWIKQGNPVTKEIPIANRKGEYNIKVNKDLYCDIDYVKAKKDEKMQY
ncbi:sulfurtransferase [Clostridium sp.]